MAASSGWGMVDLGVSVDIGNPLWRRSRSMDRHMWKRTKTPIDAPRTAITRIDTPAKVQGTFWTNDATRTRIGTSPTTNLKTRVVISMQNIASPTIDLISVRQLLPRRNGLFIMFEGDGSPLTTPLAVHGYLVRSLARGDVEMRTKMEKEMETKSL
ncbi:hypothetical protein CC2G_011265 [Coprinopsis cinerea AmutBmut pab1-1]|nr:hypothetical protein CC2G_011265 [Coprinopsis cinerea AmutBmut pab1-1]